MTFARVFVTRRCRWGLYVNALYWAFTTLSTTGVSPNITAVNPCCFMQRAGFGDIVPVDNISRLVSMHELCVWTYTRTRVYTHTHTRAHTRAHTRTHTRTRTHTHTHTHNHPSPPSPPPHSRIVPPPPCIHVAVHSPSSAFLMQHRRTLPPLHLCNTLQVATLVITYGLYMNASIAGHVYVNKILLPLKSLFVSFFCISIIIPASK